MSSALTTLKHFRTTESQWTSPFHGFRDGQLISKFMSTFFRLGGGKLSASSFLFLSASYRKAAAKTQKSTADHWLWPHLCLQFVKTLPGNMLVRSVVRTKALWRNSPTLAWQFIVEEGQRLLRTKGTRDDWKHICLPCYVSEALNFIVLIRLCDVLKRLQRLTSPWNTAAPSAHVSSVERAEFKLLISAKW